MQDTKAFRIEIVHLDKNNNSTEIEQAFKTIRREYDNQDQLINTYIFIDPSKS